MSFTEIMSKVGSNVSAALSPVSAVSGAIGGVAGLIGSIGQARRERKTAQYNYELAERAAQNQYDRQVQLMNLQNDQNVQNWDMQNEYNTPSAVRKRLEDAGLNPALMYGTSAGSVTAGGIQGGTPASAPGAVGAGSLPVGYQGDNLERMARIAQMNAQTENIEANTDKTRAQTDTEEYQQQYLSSLTSLTESQNISEGFRQTAQKLENDFLSETFLTRVETTEEQFNNLKEQTKLFSAEANLAYKRGKLTDQEVKNMEKTYEMLVDQCAITAVQRSIAENYGEKISAAELENLLASARNLRASASVSEEEYRVSKFRNDQYIKFHKDYPQYFRNYEHTMLELLGRQSDLYLGQKDQLDQELEKGKRSFWNNYMLPIIDRGFDLGSMLLMMYGMSRPNLRGANYPGSKRFSPPTYTN